MKDCYRKSTNIPLGDFEHFSVISDLSQESNILDFISSLLSFPYIYFIFWKQLSIKTI